MSEDGGQGKSGGSAGSHGRGAHLELVVVRAHDVDLQVVLDLVGLLQVDEALVHASVDVAILVGGGLGHGDSGAAHALSSVQGRATLGLAIALRQVAHHVVLTPSVQGVVEVVGYVLHLLDSAEVLALHVSGLRGLAGLGVGSSPVSVHDASLVVLRGFSLSLVVTDSPFLLLGSSGSKQSHNDEFH